MALNYFKSIIKSNVPEPLLSIASSCYWLFHLDRSSVVLFPRGQAYFVYNFGSKHRYYVPSRKMRFRNIWETKDKKVDKYTLDGFVEIDPSDTVVDIGAFIGEFSVGAAERAKKVIAIEPSPSNYESCYKNIKLLGAENIELYAEIMSDSEEIVTFKIGRNPSDNSMIDVDSGEIYHEMNLQSHRLDIFLASIGVDEIDFLKIDAEGAELEVLKGASEIEIDKIAVDVSQERLGESTLEDVRKWLLKQGYQLEVRADESPMMVYCRKKSE